MKTSRAATKNNPLSLDACLPQAGQREGVRVKETNIQQGTLNRRTTK